MVEFLPYGRQRIDDDDADAVMGALRSDWLTTGPEVDRFEEALAARVGARFAVVCSSGTAALHLAMMAAELPPSCAAIVPSMTFVATANCVRYTGRHVVFSDVDPSTGLMGPSDLNAALERAAQQGRTVRAVLPVHLNGQACAMADVAAMAKRHGLVVIEDACHALGTRYRAEDEWHAVGSCAHSDMATFSFHPVKTVAGGEGGAVTTNSEALRDRLRMLRSHGITRNSALFERETMAFDENEQVNPWYYEMQVLGFNYRITDIQCALARSQLGKLDSFAQARAELAVRYRGLLAGREDVAVPVPTTDDNDPVLHLFAVHLSDGSRRGALMRALAEAQIGSQVHYIPVHRQPFYATGDDLPGTDSYYADILSLPFFVGMTSSDVDRVVDALAAFSS